MWITQRRFRDHPSPSVPIRGFTLIELLIVIAIVGILTTVGTVSLVQARRRTRDTKRVSDIQQVRNALVIYSNTRANYPPADADGIVLGVAAQCLDDSDEGFHSSGQCGGLIIMERLPREEVSTNLPPYTYRNTGTGYTLEFRLEGEIGDLSGGLCTATGEGIACTP